MGLQTCDLNEWFLIPLPTEKSYINIVAITVCYREKK